MIDTNALVQEIGSGITQVVKEAAGNYISQAKQDSDAFMSDAKSTITEWAIQLNEGKMSKDEFEFLAVGRIKDLAQMRALTQAGIAAATLDATRAKIATLTIKAISTCVL